MDANPRCFVVGDVDTLSNESVSPRVARWNALVVATHDLFPSNEKHCNDRLRRVAADVWFNNFSVNEEFMIEEVSTDLLLIGNNMMIILFEYR
jgi:hypothetical protein